MASTRFRVSGWQSPAMASKVTDVKVAKGRRVRLETPGGGGWGDPLERDPARVARDVRFGYISREVAAGDYGVVIDSSGEVDGAATRALRLGSAA